MLLTLLPRADSFSTTEEVSGRKVLLSASTSKGENLEPLDQVGSQIGCSRRSFFGAAASVLSIWTSAKSVWAAETNSLIELVPVDPILVPLVPTTPITTPLDSNLAPLDIIPTENTQFDTVNDVPADYFTNQQAIYGFCERVIDGDTIRVRHIPNYRGGTPQPLQQRGIANVTMSIRIYAVDCPETGKNKRQVSMPFGDEAKQFTSDMVFHKVVKITLLRRDQYGRAVAVVETVPTGLFGSSAQDVSMALAQAGLAELYTGGGAVYYNRREELQAAIALAQRKKRGIWSLENRQSADDFKRQQKAQQPVSRAGAGATGQLPIMAVTGLPNQAQNVLVANNKHKSAVAAATTSHKSRRPSNKENLIDAVVTGLEFLG